MHRTQGLVTKCSRTRFSEVVSLAVAPLAPAKDYDPLYITVPLGFTRPMSMIQCPANLVCVDHPGTIDLTRLEPALKPLYPKLTDAQLKQVVAVLKVA